MIPNYFSSLIWIVCENHGFEEVAGLPSHQRLAQHGAVLNQYVAIQHPSGPNYRSLAAGNPVSAEEVLPADVSVPTFASLLFALSQFRVSQLYVPWRGESAARHQPFDDCKTPLERRDYTGTGVDLFDGLPPYAHVYLGLDDINNGHSSGSLEPPDQAITALLDTLDQSKWFNSAVGGLYPALFVVWDEAFNNPNNRVFAAWYGRGVARPPGDFPVQHNHFSFCRTATDNWGLPPLAHAAGVTPMLECFASS